MGLAHEREHFGQVLVEGMACGLPAVATRSLGPAEIIENGRTGWLVEPDEAALGAAPQIQDLWEDITPMARWEWVRWVNATKDPDTRERRVEVSISKMKSGKRRPCCFNLAACTDPDLSKSGRLVEPA